MDSIDLVCLQITLRSNASTSRSSEFSVFSYSSLTIRCATLRFSLSCTPSCAGNDDCRPVSFTRHDDPVRFARPSVQVLNLVGLYAPHASNLHMPPQNYSDGTPIPPVIFSLICDLANGTQAKAERGLSSMLSPAAFPCGSHLPSNKLISS